MSQQLNKLTLLYALKPIMQGHQALLISSGITASILLLRCCGLWQSLEWAALDQFFRLRPPEATDERILIVAIDEMDIRQAGEWPLPDAVIAQSLQKLNAQKPRVIGLHLVRDLPVSPGHQELLAAYQSIPNLIGIEQLANHKNAEVLPPRTLSLRDRVGYSNIIFDDDGKVRRSSLYWHVKGKAHKSFALATASLYLQSEGIIPRSAKNPQYLQLGKGVFPRFQSNDGGYVRADDRGYQILANFPKPGGICPTLVTCGYRTVFLRDVLANRVPSSLVRDRIVIIGSIASSLQGSIFMPYSISLIGAKPIAGIQLQAYFISQILSAALVGRPLLNTWSHLAAGCWIFIWAYIAAAFSGQLRRISMIFLCSLLSCGIISVGAYVAFLYGWWIPFVPALVAVSGSSVVVTSRIVHRQEELKRSKEFLHQVINTIPDPIFVKNQQHQWIVLNQAYSQLSGYPLSHLIEKSDYDVFPQHEADIFRSQDNLVFQSQQSHEHEEEFTTATGETHLIATKRSLHKDVAGNLFLVGVIRDITERKRIEEKLKRTAEDLCRSNDELKLSEDRLRYLVNHDALTGLPNRKFFYEKLHESLQWSRQSNLLLALLFIDLDGFKQINDSLGHDNGDRLLIIVGQRLSNSLRSSDTVSRLGGDEFTVILRGIPTADIATTVAEKILATLAEPIVLEGQKISISASIGISLYPGNSDDSQILIKQADAAMYKAKQMGKNRYKFSL